MREPENQIFTIKDLTRYIKMKLESDNVLQDVWVRGEISNFTRHSSGHMYFTLKDKDSRIKSIMFASYNQRLPFIPKEGMSVLAQGSVSVYERDGQYQFYVTQMQPDGIGGLYLAYEQLKQKLEKEGLFAVERKRAIPKFPKAVGVITSPTGAAIRDIVITLQRRMPSTPILLYPVLVQGTQAAPSIAKAIEVMNRLDEVDVLIVGRGGGSLEELWAFNEEVVARSIHGSRIPVISAVGHETDFTIADFVADLRAATPTAAAELAVPHHMELRQQIQQLKQRLQQGLWHQLQLKRERLERQQASTIFTQPRRVIEQRAERLDRLKEQLVFRLRDRMSSRKERYLYLRSRITQFHPRDRVRMVNGQIAGMQRQLQRGMSEMIRAKGQVLASHVRSLDALSPLKVMQRGYSLAYNEQQDKLIKSINQIQLGDIIKLRLTDGIADCHVWSMEGEKNNHE